MDYSRETPSTEMILRKSPFVFKRRSEAPSAGHFIRRQPPLAVHTDRDPKFVAFLLSLRHQRGCSTMEGRGPYVELAAGRIQGISMDRRRSPTTWREVSHSRYPASRLSHPRMYGWR